jgi:hypothetical protein
MHSHRTGNKWRRCFLLLLVYVAGRELFVMRDNEGWNEASKSWFMTKVISLRRLRGKGAFPDISSVLMKVLNT